MIYKHNPRGTCASLIELELENGIIKDVRFTGGCDGNHKGISSLVKGMDAKEAAQRLGGIKCGFRRTSCPDQLSKAIEKVLGEQQQTKK